MLFSKVSKVQTTLVKVSGHERVIVFSSVVNPFTPAVPVPLLNEPGNISKEFLGLSMENSMIS